MKLLTPLLFVVPTLLITGCGPRTYTEQQVKDFVTPGRSRDEIIQRFGRPGFEMTNGVVDVVMFYNLPLSDPGVPKTFSFAGFQVRITNGVAASWSAIQEDVR